MTTMTHRRYRACELVELVRAPVEEVSTLSSDQRRQLTLRFRAVAGLEHRRLDAWSVERAGSTQSAFHWTPATTRRILGSAALRRVVSGGGALLDAVNDEIAQYLARAATGHARDGSLARWLADAPVAVRALATAESLNWARTLDEVARSLGQPPTIAAADVYYDVASARTTLRARRDLVIDDAAGRVIVRVRNGSPGRHAGPGLRSDLTIDALGDVEGQAARRFIGVWPDAGVVLAVEGTFDNLRAGARDLVRTAVAQQRQRPLKAA